MNPVETALNILCEGDSLVGIISTPADFTALQPVGVVIVVGGPQYRVGSHRQFVLLAWRLAAAGFAVIRFDYRGMGDSEGDARDFESVQNDIAAAADALQRQCAAVQQVVLFGLCDGASASLLYVGTSARLPDRRVVGLCLLNPWVRSEATLARTHLKHHYSQRLLQADFWRKLASGGFNWRRSAAELWANLRKTAASAPLAGSAGADGSQLAGFAVAVPFQHQMARSFLAFQGSILLVLSGEDYTAKEFLDCAQADPEWRGALQRPGLQRLDIPGADHTFSHAGWRTEVEQSIVLWITQTQRTLQP